MKDQNNLKNQDGGGDHGHGKAAARQPGGHGHQDNQGPPARGGDDNAGDEDIRQQRLQGINKSIARGRQRKEDEGVGGEGGGQADRYYEGEEGNAAGGGRRGYYAEEDSQRSNPDQAASGQGRRDRSPDGESDFDALPNEQNPMSARERRAAVNRDQQIKQPVDRYRAA